MDRVITEEEFEAAIKVAEEKASLRASRDFDPYTFKTAHRRLAWMFRLSVGSNIVQLFCIIILVSLIGVLLPLKTTDVALIRADPSDDRIYRVEPIARQVPGFDLMLEIKARRYVKMMLEIDPISQAVRFQEAFTMTDEGFYQQFRKEHIDTENIQDAINDGLIRSIVVESADRISLKNGIYQYAVDFVQIDKRRGKRISKRKLRAYLAITLRPHEKTEVEKFENPLGVRVINMIVKEVKQGKPS